ncbi:MAG: hypothetical protein ACYCX5_12560 [Coriobacteriia bacterium]
MIQAVEKYSQAVAGGVQWMQRVYGNQFLLSKASAPVDVEFFDIDGQLMGKGAAMLQGMSATFPETVTQINVLSASGQTVEFYVSDSGFELTGAIDGLSVKQIAGATLTQAAAVAVGAGLCVSVLAANTDRKEAIVFCPSTHTGPVYIRGNSTQAVSALALWPGERVSLPVTAQLFAYNGEAGSVTLQISEIAY